MSHPVPARHFNGPVYEPQHDFVRLTGQIRRVYDAMSDGHWRTLEEIAALTGDPVASISAQLRHLRKDRFGGHDITKRNRGSRAHGLWEYRMTPPRDMAPAADDNAPGF